MSTTSPSSSSGSGPELSARQTVEQWRRSAAAVSRSSDDSDDSDGIAATVTRISQTPGSARQLLS